jgi:uncharacterized protein (TIGR00369 family)
MATIIDTAGAICASVNGRSRMVATQDLTVSYLRPARVGPVRATATLLRAGRAATVVEVRCTDEGAGARLCAVALVTCVSIGEVPAHVTALPPPAQP